MRRVRWRNKPNYAAKEEKKPIKPGDLIVVDKMESQTPGLIPQMSGMHTRLRYKVATIFVDVHTRYTWTHLQTTTNASETLIGKRNFEIFSRQNGIKIKGYHSDNGIFSCTEWRNDCQIKMQATRYTGVGAHHQNGIVERKIQTLQDMSRAMLIHAHNKWNKVITVNLWTLAISYATRCINAIPSSHNDFKSTPEQMYTKSTESSINIIGHHTFGCPVFVLKREMQDNQRIMNKWDTRARIGAYMGQSNLHSSKVSLILNINTGHISPQFH